MKRNGEARQLVALQYNTADRLQYSFQTERVSTVLADYENLLAVAELSRSYQWCCVKMHPYVSRLLPSSLFRFWTSVTVDHSSDRTGISRRYNTGKEKNSSSSDVEVPHSVGLCDAQNTF